MELDLFDPTEAQQYCQQREQHDGGVADNIALVNIKSCAQEKIISQSIETIAQNHLYSWVINIVGIMRNLG